MIGQDVMLTVYSLKRGVCNVRWTVGCLLRMDKKSLTRCFRNTVACMRRVNKFTNIFYNPNVNVVHSGLKAQQQCSGNAGLLFGPINF